MPVVVAEIDIQIPYANSLKDKRHVVKSIIERLRHHFNVSVAEMDDMDVWRRAVIGIACICNSSAVANSEINKAINYIENNIGDYQIDKIRVESF